MEKTYKKLVKWRSIPISFMGFFLISSSKMWKSTAWITRAEKTRTKINKSRLLFSLFWLQIYSGKIKTLYFTLPIIVITDYWCIVCNKTNRKGNILQFYCNWQVDTDIIWHFGSRWGQLPTTLPNNNIQNVKFKRHKINYSITQQFQQFNFIVSITKQAQFSSKKSATDIEIFKKAHFHLI